MAAAAMPHARAFPTQTAKPPAGTLSEEFLARLPQMMEFGNVPGLSVAIIKDGSVAWARGFGVREAGSNSPVDNETLFGVGSLSKPVFAYAVLKTARRETD